MLLRLFRLNSVLEGISLLSILSISLGLISRDYVFMVGMSHGVLFISYLVLSLWLASKQGWGLVVWLPLFLASFVPFGFIPVDVFLHKQSAPNN